MYYNKIYFSGRPIDKTNYVPVYIYENGTYAYPYYNCTLGYGGFLNYFPGFGNGNCTLGLSSLINSYFPGTFPNGTYSFPLFGAGLTGALGLGSLSNFFPGFGLPPFGNGLYNTFGNYYSRISSYFPRFGYFGRMANSVPVLNTDWESLIDLYLAFEDIHALTDESERIACFHQVFCKNLKTSNQFDTILR